MLAYATATTANEPIDFGRLGRLRQRMHDDYTKGNYHRVIQGGLQAVEMTPYDPSLLYNLAVGYALSGDRENALLWFGRSANAGFKYWQRAASDPDLAAIRGDPAYDVVLTRIHLNTDRFEDRAAKAEPIIIFPLGYDGSKPAPLIVTLHGFGGTPEWAASLWDSLATEVGAIVMAPRSIHRIARGRYQWMDVEDGEYVVLDDLRWMRQRYNIDGDRIILTGYSQGGAVAFAVGMRNTRLFSGIIPVAAFYDPAAAGAPRKASARRPRVFMLIGEEDSPRTVESNRQAVEDYSARQIEVRLKVFPGLGHAWPIEHINDVRAALEFVLQR